MSPRSAFLAAASSLALAILGIAACAGGPPVPESPQGLHRVPPAAWDRLAAQRIVFAHQSVGHNIVAGLTEVGTHFPAARLRIAEAAPSGAAAEPGLVHFTVGTNGVPHEKVNHFARFVDASPGAPDIALVKFCYIDIDRRTDVGGVFDHYRTQLAALQARHPQTTFVHVTAPLRTAQTGWKVPVKRLLGREPGGHADNIKREEYNRLLRAEYAGKAPVFDLAAIESTLPDARRVTFSANGDTFFGLAPEYTTDGGHLNATGRRIVAEHLLVVLAEVAARRGPSDIP